MSLQASRMTPLNVHIIHYKTVLSDLGIGYDARSMEEYLNGGRQDILENFDIFCDNVRSKNRKDKDFNLFNICTHHDGAVIVVGLYLELLEFWGKRSSIYDIVNFYCSKYPNNKVVVTWNHDVDAAEVFHFIDEFPNLYILNFNTSKEHERSIVLPFWTIDEEEVDSPKSYQANLICSMNNSLRNNLAKSLMNEPGVIVANGLPLEHYKNALSRSRFTFCPRGIGLSSYRFFECFHLNTIPVLLADDVVLPMKNKIDYDKVTVKIPESFSNDSRSIMLTLNSVDQSRVSQAMKSAKVHFSLLGVQMEVKERLQ